MASNGVQQSGNITPGHLSKWVANGVIGDAGANPYSQRVLASILNADFNDTADQPLALPQSLNAFQLTGILVAAPSTFLSSAVGGFYTGSFKSGDQIVADTQIYTALANSGLLMNATLTAYAQEQFFTRSQLADWAVYFSLTTPHGSEATASIYLIGIELL